VIGPERASERTQLAWQRFAFATAIVGALALRAGVVERHPVPGFALAAVMGALAAFMQLAGPRMEPEAAVRLALGATLVAALGALALAVVA